MPTFTEVNKEKQRVKELYDMAKNKGGTTWELNFLCSIKEVIDGKRPLTAAMDEKLQELAVVEKKGGYDEEETDGIETEDD